MAQGFEIDVVMPLAPNDVVSLIRALATGLPDTGVIIHADPDLD